MKLSEKRADTVESFLSNNGLKRSRISVIGYGEPTPMVDNTGESGRDNNLRVELAIVADESLKKEAKSSSCDLAKQ